MNKELRWEAIKYKASRGIYQRDSDIYFLYEEYSALLNKETNETDTPHSTGTSRSPEENVPGDNEPRRPAKERVRTGGYLRTEPSDSKNPKLEGGE